MRIPSGPLTRHQLYRELVEHCLVSRNDRIASYERWRAYYLWGCGNDDEPAVYNKIEPAIDLFTSFVFAGETTRFGIELGDTADQGQEIPKARSLKHRLNKNWHNWNTDIVYSGALEWSCSYGSMFVKLVPRGKRLVPYMLEPHNFGVLREDMAFLDDQEAFVHVYTIAKSAFDRMLTGHPRAREISETVSASMRQSTHDAPAGVQRIILSNMPMTGAPNGPGELNYPLMTTDGYRAKLAEETVELHELWVWDDDLNDYRVGTVASGGITVYDRKNFFIDHEHPFVQVCPLWQYDYFWGRSMVDGLIGLQDLREVRLAQIRELLDRQVKPPSTQTGAWQGVPDETAYAAQVFGASLATADPTAKINVHYPTVPADVFAEIREIDTMFDEKTGQPKTVQGKGESGVRSRGHASELARLGSARTKKKAFTLEDGLEKIAYLMLRGMQVYDDTPLWIMDDKGERAGKFIAEQFTKDYTVKVDGHSSSPIFTEDQKQLAIELFKAKAIDRGELIDQMDPPNRQELKHGLKGIEAKEAAAAKAQQEAEARKEGLKAVK